MVGTINDRINRLFQAAMIEEDMSWEQIRPLVVGIARRECDILLAELFDSADDGRFYRPVGGGIEFGESSSEALRREFREELDVEIKVTDYIGTIENIFTFHDTKCHEVVMVHSITIPDGYAETLPNEGMEDDGTTFIAEWKPISLFLQGDVPLYPDGLLTLLTSEVTHVTPTTEGSKQ